MKLNKVKYTRIHTRTQTHTLTHILILRAKEIEIKQENERNIERNEQNYIYIY